jgi:hypothetical protein
MLALRLFRAFFVVVFACGLGVLAYANAPTNDQCEALTAETQLAFRNIDAGLATNDLVRIRDAVSWLKYAQIERPKWHCP